MVNEILATVEQAGGGNLLQTLMNRAGMVVNGLLPDIEVVRRSSTPEMIGAVLGGALGAYLGREGGVFLHGVDDPRPMGIGAAAGATLGALGAHFMF